MVKSWLAAALSLGAVLSSVHALEVQLDETRENQQKCAGMYDRETWGGPVDPFISVTFPEVKDDADAQPIVSLLIFEWKDYDLIGRYPSAEAVEPDYICDTRAVELDFCTDADAGKWITQPDAVNKSSSPILNEAVNLKSSQPFNYPIKKTGYYCVAAAGYTTTEFMGVVEFREAYGELPATQIAKLPFYGIVTILYAVIVVFWAFLYYQHRYDILPVQNYITAILVFLVVEMLMTWGFYQYMNKHGSNVGSKVLLVLVAVLNAFRNSFSFFLLLIVCMGYGVVKPSLGRTMVYVRWLAIAHFVFGLAYAITSLLVSPDTANPFLLLVVLPLAATLTAFYVWTLNSLNFTLKDLRERKQHVKEAMYKKLWWCILASIMVIFGFFFFNSFTLASAGSPDFVPFHWKSRWFVLDGWLNLIYFADVAWVAYVWRPTANNRRFAMSDEIAQDENGEFEFADIGAPDDSDDESDEEARVGTKPSNTQGTGANAGPASGASRQQQPPQQEPNQVRSQTMPEFPRDSFDEDAVFAVGEDGDKFSDDESDDEEESKLVSKKR